MGSVSVGDIENKLAGVASEDAKWLCVMMRHEAPILAHAHAMALAICRQHIVNERIHNGRIVVVKPAFVAIDQSARPVRRKD